MYTDNKKRSQRNTKGAHGWTDSSSVRNQKKQKKGSIFQLQAMSFCIEPSIAIDIIFLFTEDSSMAVPPVQH